MPDGLSLFGGAHSSPNPITLTLITTTDARFQHVWRLPGRAEAVPDAARYDHGFLHHQRLGGGRGGSRPAEYVHHGTGASTRRVFLLVCLCAGLVVKRSKCFRPQKARMYLRGRSPLTYVTSTIND